MEALCKEGQVLKVHKHEIFFGLFLQIFDFKHFRACSACDEISSAYAQHAMKFVPRLLSVR
jgi:hypothetical protein